jgi:hypothetical protein
MFLVNLYPIHKNSPHIGFGTGKKYKILVFIFHLNLEFLLLKKV